MPFGARERTRYLMQRWPAKICISVVAMLAVAGTAWAEPRSTRQVRFGGLGAIARTADVARSIDALDSFRRVTIVESPLDRHPLHDELTAEVRAGLQRASRRAVKDALVEATGLQSSLDRLRPQRDEAPTAVEGNGVLDLDLGFRGLAPRLGLDVTDTSSVERFAAAVAEHTGGGLSLLVNNAGGALGLDPVEAARDEQWEWMFQANVMGTLRVTRALLSTLAASGSVFCAGHDLKELTAHRDDNDRTPGADGPRSGQTRGVDPGVRLARSPLHVRFAPARARDDRA